MNKVLVLGYNDNPAEGHALSRYRAIKAKGNPAFFLSLFSEYADVHEPYFIDVKRDKLKFFFYRLCRKIHSFRIKQREDKGEYCFYNTSNYFYKSAKEILKKTIKDPDVIIFGWCDYFISPKTVYDLFQQTHAKIIIPMIDAHILGGGCHYPCGCKQYENGCRSCPVLTSPKVARRLYKKKLKYLSDIPFVIVGTKYDLERAKKTPFLRNKDMISTIGIPEIPFVKEKISARKEFGIDSGDFVILCGGYSLKDKRKGFSYLLEALRLFSDKIEHRNVVLLLLGKGAIDESLIDKKIKLVSPGFLNLEGLFTAYYAADVFISASVDDSGPYMVNYSIACGTPVISFPIGIALDIVKHKQTGYLAKFLDSNDLSAGILDFYRMSKDEAVLYSKNCVSLMEELKTQSVPWYLSVVE